MIRFSWTSFNFTTFISGTAFTSSLRQYSLNSIPSMQTHYIGSHQKLEDTLLTAFSRQKLVKKYILQITITERK